MYSYDKLILCMMDHDRGNPNLIQHFLKVHAFARLIGVQEGLDERTLHILETAAIVHDIGILPSLRVYGDDAGRHQEELGPAQAETMLSALGYDRDVIDRVCLLVSRHHTYTGILGMDHQILIEADALVNLFENSASWHDIYYAYQVFFQTETGKALMEKLYFHEKTQKEHKP